jgi:LmbE family N-acetylglucosaminyl deacetylase
MKALRLGDAGDRLSILCLGAHADDIEIGAGGSLMAWIEQGLRLDVLWCVLSGDQIRQAEARASAREFLSGATAAHIETLHFKDGFFPAFRAEIKDWFETLKLRTDPDLILTHRLNDAHQDHREVSRHSWNTFRNHLVLEYEIPKWDGDMHQPNLYVPLPAAILDRKISLLMKHYPTQRPKHWFDEEVFRGLARLRGVESAERYAEAFFARKLVMG